MRKEEVEAGRSINLALSDRGIKALQEVGIADEILELPSLCMDVLFIIWMATTLSALWKRRTVYQFCFQA